MIDRTIGFHLSVRSIFFISSPIIKKISEFAISVIESQNEFIFVFVVSDIPILAP